MQHFPHFEGADAIFAIVAPQGLLAKFGVPLLPIILPIAVEGAVEGGEEIESLLHPRKGDVLHEHCIVAHSGEEVPLLREVLEVVGAVLEDAPGGGVGQYYLKEGG